MHVGLLMINLKEHSHYRKKIYLWPIVVVLLLLGGCGKSVSVSFDSADGLTKKQIENEIRKQTDDYGDDAQDQADKIYDSAAEKGLSGYDSLIQKTEDIVQGKASGIDLTKLTKSGLYYFLVVKQYLYNHFLKVLAVLWLVVGMLMLFFWQKNKAAAKAILTVFGFGVTIFLAILIFSPI